MLSRKFIWIFYDFFIYNVSALLRGCVQTNFPGLYLWLLHLMWILHCFRILMITFREIFPKYLKICLEYSLNMAEAAGFSMPDAFAKDYLDRIIKKKV